MTVGDTNLRVIGALFEKAEAGHAIGLDLLAACKGLLTWLEKHHAAQGASWGTPAHDARVAIAKAESYLSRAALHLEKK